MIILNCYCCMYYVFIETDSDTERPPEVGGGSNTASDSHKGTQEDRDDVVPDGVASSHLQETQGLQIVFYAIIMSQGSFHVFLRV